ncbi:MAG: (2Fe-2S)-binding protein [Spirochaetales bacterium]|nr:(2Fe-2S)-binding protein [Spirochaetales bacterium]
MSRVTLEYDDHPAVNFDASPVLSVLIAAQRAGVPLRHDCGGKALCGTCRVRVLSGKLSPVGEREQLRLGAIGADTDTRLACQAHAGSDLVLKALLPLKGTETDDRQK